MCSWVLPSWFIPGGGSVSSAFSACLSRSCDLLKLNIPTRVKLNMCLNRFKTCDEALPHEIPSNYSHLYILMSSWELKDINSVNMFLFFWYNTEKKVTIMTKLEVNPQSDNIMKTCWTVVFGVSFGHRSDGAWVQMKCFCGAGSEACVRNTLWLHLMCWCIEESVLNRF